MTIGRTGRHLRVVLAMVVVLAGLASAASEPAVAASPTSVSVVDPDVTVRPTDHPVGTTAADLRAARNEFESFQVVVQAGATTVPNLDVRLQQALSGPSTIPANNVTVYREDYYSVVTPSDGEVASPTGRWPDALIPRRDTFYGETRNAFTRTDNGFHLDVPANENRVAWVDVLVPVDAVAGYYHGSLLVTGTGFSVTVPIRLEVLPVTLPATSALKTLFLTDYQQICNAHRGDFHCGLDANGNWNQEERYLLHSLYTRAALENRVTIANPVPRGQEQGPPNNSTDIALFDRYIKPLIVGTSPQEPDNALLPVRLRDPSGRTAKLTTLTALSNSFGDSPANDCGDPASTCLADWSSFASDPAHGSFNNRFQFYACDEPGGADTWTECDKHLSNTTPFPKLVTQTIQATDSHGTTGKISTLVPVLNDLADKPNNPYAGDQRPAYDNFVATPGKQLWLYQGDLQCGSDGPDSGNTTWNGPFWNGWAGLALDQPASQTRAMGWEAFEYATTGVLYWHTTADLPTAWSAGGLYEQGCNGDGTLFYPGVPAGGNGMPAVGGTHDIPIESLRLKRMRDGVEDNELLQSLVRSGRSTDANSIAAELFSPAPPYSNTVRDRASYTATWTAAAIAHARLRLTDALKATAHPAPRLAYTHHGADDEVYVMNGDGTGQRNITNDPGQDTKPSWSPDGTKIAYAHKGTAAGSTWDIFVRDADGTGTPVNLTPNSGGTDDIKPTWSPDGSRVLFTRTSTAAGSTSDLVVTTADGTSVKVVTPNTPGSIDDDGAWSPDGTRIAYASRSSAAGASSDVLVRSADGIGNPTNLTAAASPSADDDLPAWSPDGSKIAFDTLRDVDANGNHQYEVYVMSANGSSQINLTKAPASHDYDPSWSPDGTSIVFTRGIGTAAELIAMNATDGSGQHDITNTDGSDTTAEWGRALHAAADITLPVTITAPVVVDLNADVHNVTPANLVLRTSGGANVGGMTVTCATAAGAAVSCSTGPVRRITLAHSALMPGEYYWAVVNPAGAAAMVDAASAPVNGTSRALRAAVGAEENSPSITYGWQSVTNASADGGSYVREHLAGATVTVTFSGTSIGWHAVTGPDGGRSSASVDSGPATTYDDYAAARTYQVARSLSGLTATTHTLRITVAGTKQAASAGTWVSLDSFTTGTVSYGWPKVTVAGPSGGAYVRTDTVTASTAPSASFTFRGTGAIWYTVTSPDGGTASVYVDGTLRSTVSNYSAATTYNVARDTGTLPDGVHTLKIVNTATQPAGSTGTFAAIDRFVVR